MNTNCFYIQCDKHNAIKIITIFNFLEGFKFKSQCIVKTDKI